MVLMHCKQAEAPPLTKEGHGFAGQELSETCWILRMAFGFRL